MYLKKLRSSETGEIFIGFEVSEKASQTKVVRNERYKLREISRCSQNKDTGEYRE